MASKLETFVVSQLRPETVVAQHEPRLYHLRTEQGRRELDVIGELGGGRVIGIEIKAKAAPTPDDAKHLACLRDELGDRFVAGVVFHTGPQVYSLGESIAAVPIAALWG